MLDESLSVCVCTSGRPDELSRCLASIRRASRVVEIVVTCDGPAPDSCRAIAKRHGTRFFALDEIAGLCQSRNVAIARASRDYVMLLDDDAMLGEGALVALESALARAGSTTILSGQVNEPGGIVGQGRATYLGFFAKASGKIEQINLNANLFPRSAFRHARFDEAIEYGYEDMDLCFCLLSKGFEIEFVPNYVNMHRPPQSPEARNERWRQSQRARFYVSLRRRLTWTGNRPSAMMYVWVALAHALLAEGRSLRRASEVLHDMCWAVSTAWRRRNVSDESIFLADDRALG